MKKVVLVGYMGCGKSIISKELSQHTLLTSIELDEYIEKKAQKSIKTIFAEKGELYFRKLEHTVFLELMNTNQSFILSTGGGTLCYYDNHKLLQQENCISIYLKASINTLYDRLLLEKENRPIIASIPNEALKEFIAKHLFERSYYYNQSQYIVEVDEKSIPQIVKEIELLLA